tara:strand:- start:2388 stop:2933 length:546 start_codon:yes stop_codon:yes gene_type:complete
MKITKELVKQIIQEEIDKQLEEQMTDAELDAAEKAAMAKGFEPITDKPTMIKGYPARTETKMMQVMLNLALKGMNSKLPPLKVDGKFGPKTRAANAEVRKNLKKQNVKVGKGSTHAERMIDGMARLAGMSKEKLKKIAVAKVVGAELEPAVARIDKEIATVDRTASPAGIFTKESFERFLK